MAVRGAAEVPARPEGPAFVVYVDDSIQVTYWQSTMADPGPVTRKKDTETSRGPHLKGAGPGHVPREPPAHGDSRTRQAGTMFSACGPFWPCVTSKVTFWPS